MSEALESAARLVLEKHVDSWVEGAIFPCEMAYFIARCQISGVRTVIESGRQDGYSTKLLGLWAKSTGAEIVSIDLEHDEKRAAQCHQLLSGLPITLVKGNAYAEVGRFSRAAAAQPMALLADGPKGWPALSLIAAATRPNVRLIALHNLADGVPERPWFVARGGRFYEDESFSPGPRWRELRAAEIAHAQKQLAVRSLERSSLGVLLVDDQARSRIRSVDAHFGLHQPKLVSLLWDLGLFGLTPKLYGLSYRLLGK